MINHMIVLGLSPPVRSEDVRSAYLRLVRAFPPSRYPARAAQIRAAYEALTDDRKRVESELFWLNEYSDALEVVDALEQAIDISRPPVSLKSLIAAEGPKGDQA